MLFRALIAALLAATAVSGSPTRLQFTAPAGWTQSTDPATQLTALSPPGGNASVILVESKEFGGTPSDWLNQLWQELSLALKPAGTARNGKQGDFATRLGVFTAANGATPWACVYGLIRNGRGEGLVYFAANEALFLAHLPTVDALARNITSASPPTPAASEMKARPSAPPAGPHAGGVDGLYLATTQQFRLNPFGSPGSGSWEARTEFYLLSPDGQVYRGRDLPNVPGGDLSRFDFAAARREAPGNYGTYQIAGNQVLLRFGDGPVESITATRGEPDTLEIRSTKFKRTSPGQKPAASPK